MEPEMEPINICAICLRTNKRLNKTDDNLLSAYHNQITNNLLKQTNTLYCCECEYLLRKTYRFHQKCYKAAEILKSWLASEIKRTATQGKKKISLDMLHQKLPQTNLAPWTTKNNVAFHIRCSSPIDDPIHIGNTNQDDNSTITVARVMRRRNIEKELGFKNITPVKNKNTTSNPNTKPTSKRTYEAVDVMPLMSKILKKKDGNATPNIKMKLSDVKSLATPKQDKYKLTERHSLKSDEAIKSEILDDDIEWLEDDDDFKLELNETNDENDVLDDVSLTSDEDCEVLDGNTDSDATSLSSVHWEDYLSEPPEIQNIPSPDLNDTDINDDDLTDIDTDDSKENFDDYVTINPTMESAYASFEKIASLQRDVDSKIVKITEDLDSICENWEISALKNTKYQYVSKDEILEFYRKFLTDRDVANVLCPDQLEEFKKMSVESKLAVINSDLEDINEVCVNIVEDHSMKLVVVKQRVKEDLLRRVEKYGELKAKDGTVFDVDNIVKLLDLSQTIRLRRIMKNLRDTRNKKRLNAALTYDLKMILTKEKVDKNKSVFDIQHLRSEEEAIEEFQQRKNYECYINANFKCEICYLPFQYVGLLDYHMKLHSDQPGPFWCSLCKLNLISLKSLRQHKRSHKFVYKCKLCPLVTYYEKSMQCHADLHNGKVYKCEKCDTVYKSKAVLGCHQSRVHPSDGRVCTICGGVFYSASGLKWHIHRKHPEGPPAPSGEEVSCELCNNTFSSAEAFKTHQATLHRLKSAQRGRGRPRGGSRGTNRSAKKSSMTCILCNKVCMNYQALVGHFSLEHPGQDIQTAYAATYVHLCHICGKGFKSLKNLQTHMSANHAAGGYKCPECGKHCPSGAALYSHQFTHGPRTFCCEQCGKKFRTPSNLYNHMRSHTKDHRFECNICGKKFLFRAAITEHIRGVHHKLPRVRKGAGGRTKRSRSIEPDADYSERCNSKKDVHSKRERKGDETAMEGVTYTNLEVLEELGDGMELELGAEINV